VITDTLEQADRYATLHPAFAPAFAWLRVFASALVDGSLADGAHPIGGGCEARVMTYVTASADEKRWESHRRFIDIQHMVRGCERMDVCDVGRLESPTAYTDAEDVLFYGQAARGEHHLLVDAGNFAIFFPHDGHRPSIAVGIPTEVRKVVIKVPVEALGA
jgi:biofilm protein TabA